MDKLFLMILASFIAFACFACDDDCNCPDEEAEEMPTESFTETEVFVTISGPDVADRKVYAETCEGDFQASGPKDPVPPDATEYFYIFKLRANVLIYEDGTREAGDPICYRIFGSPDPSCDPHMQSDEIWLDYLLPQDVEIMYEDCSYD